MENNKCMAEVNCTRPADCIGIIYKDKNEKRMCYKCACLWLKNTSRCPKCGKELKECSGSSNKIPGQKGSAGSKACEYNGSLDRGIIINWENFHGI
jgi:hypothetical protein